MYHGCPTFHKVYMRNPFSPFEPDTLQRLFTGDDMKLTRFERARILGSRALQLSLGAPPLVKLNEVDPLRIAQREMENGVIPLTVRHTKEA